MSISDDVKPLSNLRLGRLLKLQRQSGWFQLLAQQWWSIWARTCHDWGYCNYERRNYNGGLSDIQTNGKCSCKMVNSLSSDEVNFRTILKKRYFEFRLLKIINFELSNLFFKSQNFKNYWFIEKWNIIIFIIVSTRKTNNFRIIEKILERLSFSFEKYPFSF